MTDWRGPGHFSDVFNMLYNRHTVRYACSMDLKQGYTMGMFFWDKGVVWKGVGLAHDTCSFLFFCTVTMVLLS